MCWCVVGDYVGLGVRVGCMDSIIECMLRTAATAGAAEAGNATATAAGVTPSATVAVAGAALVVEEAREGVERTMPATCSPVVCVCNVGAAGLVR